MPGSRSSHARGRQRVAIGLLQTLISIFRVDQAGNPLCLDAAMSRHCRFHTALARSQNYRQSYQQITVGPTFFRTIPRWGLEVSSRRELRPCGSPARTSRAVARCGAPRAGDPHRDAPLDSRGRAPVHRRLSSSRREPRGFLRPPTFRGLYAGSSGASSYRLAQVGASRQSLLRVASTGCCTRYTALREPPPTNGPAGRATVGQRAVASEHRRDESPDANRGVKAPPEIGPPARRRGDGEPDRET